MNIIQLRCDDSVILVPLNTCCVLITYRLIPADMLKPFVCQTITSKVGRNIAFLPLQRLKFYPRMVKQIQIFQSKFCRTAHHDPAFHCKPTRTQSSAVVLTTSSQLLLKPRLHDTTCCQTRCQTGCTTRFDNRLNERLFVQHGCQTRLTTGLTTCCIVYTNIQPVVKQCLSNRLYNPVWQPVERTAVRSTRLSNRYLSRYTNNIESVNGCQTCFTTNLTTGWMFVYTIQPVVKPVWQQVVSCKRGLRYMPL